jgi:hypothetical protein
MTKRGVVLIFSLLVVVFLSIILGAFFLKSINENNLARRFVSSTQAFWVAETGVAQAIRNLPDSPTNGNLGNFTYQTNTTFRTTINASDYYDIASTGIVDLPSGGDVRRTLNVVVRTEASDPSKFQYAMQAANDICFGAQCKKDPTRWIHPDTCNGHSCWKEFDATINFRDLFGYELSEVSAVATHYTQSTFPGAVTGVNWVDVSSGGTLRLEGNSVGSGLLIVNGKVEGRGTYDFYGIIYVLGTFKAASGTLGIHGSVVVASSVGIDDFSGTADLYWDQDEVGDALDALNAAVAGSSVSIVSWKEP